MYLALRATGNLIWPILLHATTDPTLFLHGNDPVNNVFGIWVGQNPVIISLTGLVLLIVLIVSERRRVKEDRQASTPVPA